MGVEERCCWPTTGVPRVWRRVQETTGAACSDIDADALRSAGEAFSSMPQKGLLEARAVTELKPDASTSSTATLCSSSA